MTKNSFLILLLLTLLSMFAAGNGNGARPRQVPTSTPEATVTEVPQFQLGLSVADAWPEYEVEAHGLTISYPPGWLFFDPTGEESTVSLAVRDVPFLSEKWREILPEPVPGVDSEVVGLGIQLQSGESVELGAVNKILVDVVPAQGDTLHRLMQDIATQLRWGERVDLDRVGAVTGLRPQGEVAGSIRFREGGDDPADAEKVVWIVIVESADAEAHLVLRFEILAEELESQEPLLSEIVYRVQWDGQTRGTQPSIAQPTGRLAEVNRSTGMRSGPGEGFPLTDWVTDGQQLALVRPGPSGDWWLAAYLPADTDQDRGSAVDGAGRWGWVLAQAVTVNAARDGPVESSSLASQSASTARMLKLANPFALPAERIPEDGSEADTTWTVFEERSRQLSIFYPQGGLFFEASQPAPADLAALSSALGERVTAADIGELVPVQVDQSWTGIEGDSRVAERTVWIGFLRAGNPDNVYLASYTSADFLTLEQLEQRILVSLYTSPQNAAFEIVSAGMVSGLRPGDEEVISLRYRAGGNSDEKESVVVWQVIMQSPGSKSILALDFFYTR